jgi:hypothetical protein
MAAAAACVILVSGAVVYFQREPPPRQQAHVETPAATPQPAPPARHEQPVAAPRATVVPAFLLAPGLLRSGGGMPIVRVGEAQNVRLQLLLESDDYQRYRVSVETPEGRSVFSRTGLGAVSLKKDRAVSFTLPASALTPGDYIVRLASADEGVVSESVADYPFRAAQR